MSIDHSSLIIFHENRTVIFSFKFAFDIKISFDIVSKKIFFIIGMTLEARLVLYTTESVVFCFLVFYCATGGEVVIMWYIYHYFA